MFAEMCDMYRCPPNYRCDVAVKRPRTNSILMHWMYRAECHQLGEGSIRASYRFTRLPYVWVTYVTCTRYHNESVLLQASVRAQASAVRMKSAC